MLHCLYTVKRNAEDESCFAHYERTLIDGTEVSVSAKAGSTVITIAAETLEKLSEGMHTVTVEFDDGKVETSLTINKASVRPVPDTGVRP